MIKRLIITTNKPALYDSLESDLRNGVQIISDRPTEISNRYQYPLPLKVDTVIQITADLGIIHKYVLANSLVNLARKLEGKHKININEQQIPVDVPDAIRLVEDAIGREG